MKAIWTSLLISLIAGCASLGGGANKFELRSYEEKILKNGMRVLLIPDDRLPSLSFVMMVKTGSSSDPQKQSGLSSMVAELLDKGTAKRTTLELADSLGQIGASFDASVSTDYTILAASGMSFHEDQVLQDFSEIVMEPSFSETEVSRVRRDVLASLQKTVDDPDDFAAMMFDSYLFGDHPYARSPMGKMKDVKNIRRKNIIKFYLQHYRPNNAMLAVVGKFNSKDLMAKLENRFGAWSKRDIEVQNFPAPPQMSGLNVELIDKEDLKQSQIRLGHIGIKRADPDFLTLRVANTILGGAFSSRLVDEIRVKRGLTYSIASYFDARQFEGPFVVSTFTRHEKVGETVRETLRILKEFREKGVTEKEVQDAKAYLKGVFPRSLETPEALAQNLLILRFYKIPDTYLTNYLRDIDRIQLADINQVIQTHFQTDNLKVLVYSPRGQALKQLKDLGALKVKNFKEFL